jgi:AAA+ ATPase superfamily predicted ATPase
MRFIGRVHELKLLKSEYKKPDSSLVVLYGRRRVGKSSLIKSFSNQLPHIIIDGLENQSTLDQIDHFRQQLIEQLHDPILNDVIWTEWTKVFDYLTRYIEKQKSKIIILLDEFQWLSCNQSKLVSLIKSYWDQSWKSNGKLCLVLCGSISTFMVDKVIHSKALYGRVHLEMQVGPLSLSETYLMLNKKRSKLECLKYYLLFGGIPKYFELIEQNLSFNANIEKLCFTKEGTLFNEYEKIFYSQFKEPSTYERIVALLENGSKTYSEIIKTLKLSDGGGAKSYLTNLEITDFIKSQASPLRKEREKKYFISDEFIRFFYKYMKESRPSIKQKFTQRYFHNHVLKQWSSWLGLAFEYYCVKNADSLARVMGFSEEVLNAGPFFTREKDGFQVDLMFDRGDVLTLCEIKFYDKPIGIDIIKEMQMKVDKFKTHIKKYVSLEYALIAPMGVTKALRTTQYFHHIVELEDLFE